jgi:AmiR/NasT family two-component response regulator
MVSAYGGSEEIDKARKLGIECFINKPFKIETLKATIDVVCAMDSELLA